MGGKGRQGVAVDRDVLAAQRQGSLAQLPLAEQLARKGVPTGAAIFRQVRGDEDPLVEPAPPRQIISNALRQMGITRTKQIAELVDEAERIYRQHPDAGVGMTPGLAAVHAAYEAGVRIKGKPLKNSIAESLGLPNPPYDPETNTLVYEDDTPEYAGMGATDRVFHYFSQKAKALATTPTGETAESGDSVPIEDAYVFSAKVADALNFWMNHPDNGKVKGGFKPEDAAAYIDKLNPDEIRNIVSFMRQPTYKNDREGYAGLPAADRIKKRLDEAGIIGTYQNELYGEAMRRWSESFANMQEFAPEAVAEIYLDELRGEEDERFMDALEATPEKIKAVLAKIGVDEKNYLYHGLEQMIANHWNERDADEMKGVSLEEFVNKGLLGFNEFKTAVDYSRRLTKKLQEDYEAHKKAQEAAGQKPKTYEEFSKEDFANNPELKNATLERPEYEKDKPGYKGRTAEERIRKYLEEEPGWDVVAPAGSAIREQLVGETVTYWKTQDTSRLKPEEAVSELIRKRRAEMSGFAIELSKEAREEILRQARGEIHGALADDLISGGAYYYMLSHEAWRMWLESLKGSWKNGKRRKPALQFAEDVIAKYRQQMEERVSARQKPVYGNDLAGYSGLSAIERMQKRLDLSELDTAAANRILRGAMHEWSNSLGMTSDYKPEDAVDKMLGAKPANLRERKQKAGER